MAGMLTRIPVLPAVDTLTPFLLKPWLTRTPSNRIWGRTGGRSPGVGGPCSAAHPLRAGVPIGCAHTHQALLLPAGGGRSGEDDLRGLVVDAEGAGAAGGGGSRPAVVVVEEHCEVPVAGVDLPHQHIGAVVPEGVGGAVEGDVVGAPPAAAGACGDTQSSPSATQHGHRGGHSSPLGLSCLVYKTGKGVVGGPKDTSTKSLQTRPHLGKGLHSCHYIKELEGRSSQITRGPKSSDECPLKGQRGRGHVKTEAETAAQDKAGSTVPGTAGGAAWDTGTSDPASRVGQNWPCC